MTYNPESHKRKSIRLKDYDYSKSGAYFITICCENKLNRFGDIIVGAGLAPALFNTFQDNKNNDIEEGQPQGIAPTEINNYLPVMQLNEYGQIAYDEWLNLSERFNNFELNVFQIMPNHIHGIIVLNNSNLSDNKNSISEIIGAYKSLVANKCLKVSKSRNEVLGKFWQRNYYEHIIRNENSYNEISEYIINNPLKWQEDKFYNK